MCFALKKQTEMSAINPFYVLGDGLYHDLQEHRSLGAEMSRIVSKLLLLVGCRHALTLRQRVVRFCFKSACRRNWITILSENKLLEMRGCGVL